MTGSNRRVLVGIGVACFFVSGTAALLYEVVWTRLLGLIFGHTVYAVTTVLAAYMGGLALGSILLGRWADRLRRPLRAYAALEALIGAYCAATPLLFKGFDALYLIAVRTFEPSPAGAVALQFGLAAVLLLPPTTLMGATLPLLSRAVVSASRAAPSQVGSLYAINTWGAVTGTALAGLVLLPSIGQRATVTIGVLLNLIVAAVALLADMRLARGAPPAPAPSPSHALPELSDPPLPRAQIVLGLVGVGVSGAASMSYEIAWTRALSLVLGSSTYAFTAMLSAFLVGLAGGALLVSRLLRSRKVDLATFARLEIAIAFAAIALLPAFGKLPAAALWVLQRVGVSHLAAVWVQFGLSFAVIIVPTLLIGATFPVMIAALYRGVERLGRDVGSVYGANTIGTIVGSVGAGFALIPWLGVQNTIRLAAGANFAVGAVLLLVAGSRSTRSRGWLAAGAASLAILVAFVPRWDSKLMTSGVTVYAGDYVQPGAFRQAQEQRRLLFYSEGISTTVAVERTNDFLGVRVNGKMDASNGGDMATQLLLGHLGALLHPEPRRALVIGLASGVTIGALCQHPLEAIDVAELEPAMLEVSRFFEKENRSALSDPRVRVVAGDGRHVVAAATHPYDLIVSEPSNPWIAGIASLFTRDFYEIARQRLAPDGVFVQWLQGYGIFTQDVRMVIRSLQEVFPHVSVWTAAPGDFLLIATPGTLQVDAGRVTRRAEESPGLREDLVRFGWNGDGLLYRFFLDEEGARRFSAGAPLNTDDLPLLEFRAPMAVYTESVLANADAMRALRTVDRPPVVNRAVAMPLDSASGRIRAARAHWRLGWYEEAYEEILRAGLPDALSATDRLDRAQLLVLLGRLDEAMPELSAITGLSPGNTAALRLAHAASSLPPRRMSPEATRSALMERCGQHSDGDACHVALEALEAQVALTPDSVLLLNGYAGTLFRLGELPRAAVALRRAVEVDPMLANTRFNLGLILERQGLIAEAAVEYGEAQRLEPSWAAPRARLAALRTATTPR